LVSDILTHNVSALPLACCLSFWSISDCLRAAGRWFADLACGKAVCPVTDSSDVSLRKLTASCAGTACSQIIPVGKGLLGLGGTERCVGSLFFAAQSKLVAAVLFFGLLGTGLAFGFCDTAQFVGAGTFAFALSAGPGTQHREEVGAARRQHASAEVGSALLGFVLHVSRDAVAKHIEERF
jgi:hypothetical protein